MKPIPAQFPAYCEIGDHDILPGHEIEKYEGFWVHHECADIARKEAQEERELERRELKEERKALEQSWRVGSCEAKLDKVIDHAKTMWGGIRAVECDVHRRFRGDEIDVWIKHPCLMLTGTRSVSGDEIKRQDERLFWAMYDALQEMACELDLESDGIWYWAK